MLNGLTSIRQTSRHTGLKYYWNLLRKLVKGQKAPEFPLYGVAYCDFGGAGVELKLHLIEATIRIVELFRKPLIFRES